MSDLFSRVSAVPAVRGPQGRFLPDLAGGANRRPLSREELQSILAYNPETGRFDWLRTPRRCARMIGRGAGTVNNGGYLVININKKIYSAHRLAWVFVYGEWPALGIDHIDGDKLNNRISNLRLATDAENMRNRPAPKTNRSGFKGVYWHKGGRKWAAGIRTGGRNGKRIYLGLFQTPEEAHAAYMAAAARLHGDFLWRGQ